jgi:mRNA interferase HicA
LASGPVTVTVEATLQWAWLHDRLTQAGFPVQVAHPQQVKLISHARCKSGRAARYISDLSKEIPMQLQLTAVFQPVPEGYIGFVASHCAFPPREAARPHPPLEAHGCLLLREGRDHSVCVNRAKNKTSTAPRHREINDFLARKICRDLEIPMP